jgi:hypothetical protein
VVEVSDTAYMDAVAKGDMKTAQRMVDAAAKKAGYTTKVFHGSSAKFTKPNMPLFLGDESIASTYAQNRSMMYGEGAQPVMYRFYGKFNKTASEDMVKQVAQDMGFEVENDMAFSVLDPQISSGKSPRLIQELKKRGYDSAKIDDFSADDATKLVESFVAFDPSQLKLADPVTYDDKGNVIPLSQRFNNQSEDIRNPRRSMIRTKLSRILEPGDRVLDYDRAQGEDLYRLWDMVHTDKPLTKEALVEIEGMLDDDGVLVIQSGEEPSGLQDHFRKATRYQGMLLVQGPMNPEEARINTEKLRRDLE